MTVAPRTEPFAAYVALCERRLVTDRLTALDLEPESSWRAREDDDLRRYLAEIDDMIVHHRDAARFRRS